MDSYVGKRLDGRYEIREIIGVGGMAVVYKAYDNIDDRIVAIKILKEEFLANEEFRRRFKNESKAIAVLSHPNIVKVYDVSLGDKLQYIVMEYVEGITLKEYIEQQGCIAWKEAVHFASQILRALQHAHDKGIVHRDIKPQNIMLLQNGTIKVTDFGIARFSRGETRTMTEAAIGSVHYISPEQARGEITDDKADIYSVGVVLYEMITGQLPFESDSAVSVALMQLQNEATPPREIKPDLPVGLEQIVMHAMEKNPKSRYQSAAEFLLDLDELKRNPAIKFDYSYFVDKEPTKFINRKAVNDGLKSGASKGASRLNVKAPEQSDKAPIQSAYKTEKDKKKSGTTEENKKKNIIIGLVAAAAIAVILIVILLFKFTDLFGEKIEVPNFVGMNYADEIQDKYPDFEFDVDYVTSTTYDKGEVCKQNPEAGSTIKAGGTIKLEVVSGGNMMEVPDVAGKTEAQAKRLLSQAGFANVNTEEEYSTSVNAGCVIRTDPEIGEKADTQEVIVLYIATNVNENEVEVPDVEGMNYYTEKSSVAQFFSSEGLSVGTVTEKDSSQAKGIILEVSPAVGSKVNKGTSVNLVVSSGTPETTSKTITLQLPTDNTSHKMSAFLDGKQVDTDTYLCQGQQISIDVDGSADGSKLVVQIDGEDYYTATVNFASDSVSNQQYHDLTTDSSFSLFGNN